MIISELNKILEGHADWALGVGMGKKSVVVGRPLKGERSPVHLWATAMFDTIDDTYGWIGKDCP